MAETPRTYSKYLSGHEILVEMRKASHDAAIPFGFLESTASIASLKLDAHTPARSADCFRFHELVIVRYHRHQDARVEDTSETG